MTSLDGLTVLVPECRELALFSGMLEAEGAVTLPCPLVKILDLDDTSQAERWIADAIAGRFDDIIWLTGEGLRRLLAIADSSGQQPAFLAALRTVRHITRGPKPARALREVGLVPSLAAVTPTSQGVLETLASHDLTGRVIGVQTYPGDGATLLPAALAARGAQVFPITPYRYAGNMEDAAVLDAIDKLIGGAIGLVVFTATPQIERLVQVAGRDGQGDLLLSALRRTPVAAIGPVVEETLRLHGITPTLRPQTSFHLKPLVRAISAWRAA